MASHSQGGCSESCAYLEWLEENFIHGQAAVFREELQKETKGTYSHPGLRPKSTVMQLSIWLWDGSVQKGASHDEESWVGWGGGERENAPNVSWVTLRFSPLYSL